MNELLKYIKETVGLKFEIEQLLKSVITKLPIYLVNGYNWYKAELAGKPCIIAEIKENENFSISQFENHFRRTKNILGLPVIIVFLHLEAYNRKRLIEKKIAFIIPGKQLYVPDFLIDLKENNKAVKTVHAKLTPTAQLIILHQLLNQQENGNPECKTFQEMAAAFDANPMEISRAVNNLRYFDLIEVAGGKEKNVAYKLRGKELWKNLMDRQLLINPILKNIYTDTKPGNPMLSCNNTALAQYTNINPSRQEYLAVDKKKYYQLIKKEKFNDTNKYDARYCLEVWKYNPELLVKNKTFPNNVVDPLSLYLSLQNSTDERVEIALDQILSKYLW